MTESGAAAVTLSGFTLAYHGLERELLILDHVDLVIPRGGFYLLVGESGAGKSSLLALLLGLWDPRERTPRVEGRILVLGVDVGRGYPRRLRRRVAAVLQDEGLLDELSPKANVAMALEVAGRSPKLAAGLLSRAGLDDPPSTVGALSGGMRKRVAIARALALEPELFLFDEPTAGLDPDAAREMALLLAETHHTVRSSTPTTIVITHEIDAFADQADGILELDAAGKQLLFRGAQVSEAPAAPERGKSSQEILGDPALHGLRAFLLGLGSLVQVLGEAIGRLPPVYLKIVLRTTARYTVEPALFTALGAAVVGGLATFFALRNNPLEGAFTAQLMTGVGKVLTSVLIPLLIGFFFTARIAAGAAARLGTMQRTNQVAALRLLGVRPADYLLTPLVWAMCIALPIVTMAGIVYSAMASFLAFRLVQGTGSSYGWMTAFFHTVARIDLRFVLAKAVVSGFLIAILTYHLAMAPKRSGRDVGNAVNSSIVLGIVTILLVHGVLTLLQFA